MKSHRRSLVQFTLLTLFVSALVLTFAPSAQVQQGSAKVSTTMREGVQSVTFDTLPGRVIVNLPDDLRAGDTISGTVVAEPRGQSDEQKAKNLAELSGYVIELKPPEGSKQQDVTKVPLSALGSSEIRYRLYLPSFGGSGSPPQPGSNQGLLEVSMKTITPGTTGPAYVPPDIAPPQGTILVSTYYGIAPPLGVVIAENSNFLLPKIAQQGRPVEINGPFDGSFENTKVTVGGQEVPILAESPRKVVFESPSNTTGPTEIVLNERGKTTKGEYRSVGVNLSAPKTSLLKGESTTLRVEVSGLQGITESVPLHLVKGGVVSMQGGDAQTMSIKPAEVQRNGTFTTTRTITGVQAGVWSATATVVVFDVCLQDDNNGNQLSFSSITGDYIFCQFSPKSGTSDALIRTDGVMDFSGGVYVAVGDISNITKNGTFTSADFNYKFGHIHAQIDSYTHTGNATVQTSNPKRTFTITDRDTRNNTCTCK